MRQRSSLPVLRAKHDRLPFVIVAQQILSEVESRALEPARSRHALGVVDDGVPAFRGAYAAEFPYRRPKHLRTAHRQFVERIVVIDGRAYLGRHVVNKAAQIGVQFPRLGGHPDGVVTHDGSCCALVTRGPAL